MFIMTVFKHCRDLVVF